MPALEENRVERVQAAQNMPLVRDSTLGEFLKCIEGVGQGHWER